MTKEEGPGEQEHPENIGQASTNAGAGQWETATAEKEPIKACQAALIPRFRGFLYADR